MGLLAIMDKIDDLGRNLPNSIVCDWFCNSLL